jgi:RNA polymerase sigma factor (sigma-70 family)
MPRVHLGPLLCHLRRAVEPAVANALSDAQLLERYVSSRDEEAFAALVRRYGRLVRSVCRHVLGREQDVDDSFQATFLVFASRAAGIRKVASVASWLYGTAYRTAMNAQRMRRRRTEEQCFPDPVSDDQPVKEASLREIQGILDAEVNRLPEKYRAAFVLCCLEGKSRAEAARELGCKEGTVFSRLARARRELQERLTRRGVALAAALCAMEVGRAAAAVAPALTRQTVMAAVSFAAGQPLAAGYASHEVAAIAKGVIRGMVAARWKVHAIVIAMVSAIGLGVIADQVLVARPAVGNDPAVPLAASQATPAAKPAVRKQTGVDLTGDALPPGALARLGTNRLRTSRYMRFAPDGRRITLGRPDGGLQIVEVPSGKPLVHIRGTDIPQRTEIIGSTVGFTPDGKYLAAVCWEGRCGIWDTATGRLLRWLDTGLFYSIVRCDFSPDGKLLAVGRAKSHTKFDDITVGVYEVQSGRRLFAVPGTNSFFAPDGESLVAWQGYGGDGMARRSLRRVAVPTGAALDLGESPKLPDSLGYWTGQRTMKATILRDGNTLRVKNAATGKEGAPFRPTEIGHDANSAHLAPDGTIVATTSGGMFSRSLAVWDSASGKLLSDLPGHSSGIAAAVFTPNGAAVYTVAGDRTLRKWSGASGLELSRVAAEPAAWLAVSPDGKAIFAARADSGSVSVLDAQTGKIERRLPLFTRDLAGVALTSDGKRLVSAGRDKDSPEDAYRVRIHDAGTAARLAEFRAGDARTEQFAALPNATAWATTHMGQHVILWAAGRKMSEHAGHSKRQSAWVKGVTPYRIGSVALSPEGRWLAYTDQELGIAVVNARSGREVGRFKSDVYYQTPAPRYELRDVLTFSPDGKTIAWSGVESTMDIFLIEARTAQVRRRLKGDSYPVQQLVFAPDGSKLLSAGPDGSALIWDVRGPRPAPETQSAEHAADWWDFLADANAEKAYRMMREMAAHPALTVPLLRNKLKPVRLADAETLATLVAKLDATSFKEREAAARDLVALADAAEPRLLATLNAPPSLEVKRRVEDVFTRIDAGRLRTERALEVLEMIADPAALGLLRDLAAGMPEAAQTRDAAGALARVARRK